MVGWLVGLIALRRTGIYFAMITVAIGEVFYFVEFNPLSDWTGGENGLPGVPTPSLYLGFTTLHFTTGWALYPFLAACYFVGIVIALRIVRSPVGAVLSAIRDNPLRAAAVGHNIHSYKLTAFVIAAAYAGLAGGLLGVLQAFMPPEAFIFDTSGQLVMQTAIGGPGTLFGPLLGAAVWLSLQDFLQDARWASAAPGSWCWAWCSCCWSASCGTAWSAASRISSAWPSERQQADGRSARGGDPDPRRRRTRCRRARARATSTAGTILEAKGLTKRYGGLVANSDIDFTVKVGELRGIIGPNGAGKSTFFKMLTCEVPPSGGTIVFEGQDITGKGVTEVCQLGLTKSYQVNQLFTRLTVRAEPDDRRARRPARPLPPRPVPQPGRRSRA